MVFHHIGKSDVNPTSQQITLESYSCPQCNNIINLDQHQGSPFVLQCPICGQENILKSSKDSSEKKQFISNLDNLFSPLNKTAVIIGSILLFTALIPLLIPTPMSFKIDLTIVIIGIIISTFVIEQQRDISLKVTVGVILFIVFLFFITGAEIEMFLMLIFIGVSIIKILLDEYLHSILKMRMNVFLSAFLVIFMFLVIKRIINVINI